MTGEASDKRLDHWTGDGVKIRLNPFRHSCESRNPGEAPCSFWIPAFAGMTGGVLGMEQESVVRTLRMGLFFALFFLVIFAASSQSNLKAENTDSNSLLSGSIPLQPDDQFLFSQGRLSGGNNFALRSGDAPDLYFMECASSNTHNRKNGFYEVDYESHNCGIRYEGTLKDKFRFSFSSGFIHTGAGVFDSAIRNWHDAFSMSNGPRDRENQNEYVAEGILGQGERFEIERESLGLLDPTVGLSIPVYSFAGGSSLYLEGFGTIPLGLSDFSLSKPDIRTSLVLAGDGNWLNYALGLSTTFHWDRSRHGISYEPVRYSGFISSSIPVSGSFSLLLGSTIASSAVANVKRFPSYAWHIDTGFRYAFGEGHQILDIILRENPAPDKGSVDVSLFIRYGF